MNDLLDIADRLDSLINMAWEAGWSRNHFMKEVIDFSNQLRDQADDLAEAYAREHDQMDYDLHAYAEGYHGS
jgi:hypothetical protein